MRRFLKLLSVVALTLSLSKAFAAETTVINGKGISHPIGDGWHLARPTGAMFSVELPCHFNDVSTTGAEPPTPVAASRVVACRPSELSQFSAAQFEYRGDAEARKQFVKVSQTTGARKVEGYGIYPAFEMPTKLVQLDGLARCVLVGSRVIILTAEWRPPEETNVRGLVARFFGSLKIGD